MFVKGFNISQRDPIVATKGKHARPAPTTNGLFFAAAAVSNTKSKLKLMQLNTLCFN